MRNDMASLNAGKAVAQGGHACNQFAVNLRNYKREYRKWAGVRGYGTTITLAGDEKQIDDLLLMAIKDDYNCDWVIDETYPLKDGKVTHYFPCKTCAYIFAPRGYLRGKLPLMN